MEGMWWRSGATPVHVAVDGQREDAERARLRRATTRGRRNLRVEADVGDALPLGLTANGVESFFDPGRRSVSVLSLPHGLVDRLDHVRGRLKVERKRIADVERKNLVALPDNLICDTGKITNGITNIFQARGGGDFAA